MERTLISWNLPNLITVPLMAAIGFLVAGVLYQLFLKWQGNQAQASSNTGSF